MTTTTTTELAAKAIVGPWTGVVVAGWKRRIYTGTQWHVGSLHGPGKTEGLDLNRVISIEVIDGPERPVDHIENARIIGRDYWDWRENVHVDTEWHTSTWRLLIVEGPGWALIHHWVPGLGDPRASYPHLLQWEVGEGGVVTEVTLRHLWKDPVSFRVPSSFGEWDPERHPPLYHDSQLERWRDLLING